MARKRNDNLAGQMAFEVGTDGELVLGATSYMYYKTFLELIGVASKARQKYCLMKEVELPEGEEKSPGAMRIFNLYYKGKLPQLKQKLAEDCYEASSKANSFCYYARKAGVPVDLELRKKLFHGLVADGARLKFFRRHVKRQLSLPAERRAVFAVMDLEHAYMATLEQRAKDLARAAEAAEAQVTEAQTASEGPIDPADPMADAPPVSEKVQAHLKATAAQHQIDAEAYGDLSKARNVMRVIMDIALGKGRTKREEAKS